MMSFNKETFFKIAIIFLIFASFFLGYFLRENAVGGGLEFYKVSWPIIQSFKKDFLYTIYNYANPPLFDGTMPFSHIINAYLNPFSNVDTNFQLSITVISFFIFLVFASILKKFFSNVNSLDILLTSSIFLLLPFFRTSAFWGKNENYGWLFFMLSLYFFYKVRKNIYNGSKNEDILNTIFFCLTSACALYARQALVFLPISYLLYLFFNKANIKIIITSIISYAILAIPGLILIFIWKNQYNIQDVYLPIGLKDGWLHPKYILSNIPILLSFFGFYLLPILIIEFYDSKFKDFFNKYFRSFLLSILIFITLLQFGILDYLGNYILGGGAILKLNYLIAKNNFLLLLFFASMGFSILYNFFKEDKNNIIILIPFFIIYGSARLMYQEYVEPLIIILFFLALKTDLQRIYFKNISFSQIVFISYFSVYLVGSIYFKHFVFTSFEEWSIFFNSK